MICQLTFWYNLCQQLVIFNDFYVFILCLEYFIILNTVRLPKFLPMNPSFWFQSQMQVFAWQQADWIHSPRAREYDEASLSVQIFSHHFSGLFLIFIFYDDEDCICTWVGMWISVFWYFLYIDCGFDIIWAWLLDIRSHSTPLILYIHLVID